MQYEYLYKIGTRFTDQTIPSLEGWKVSKENADQLESTLTQIKKSGGNTTQLEQQLNLQRDKLRSMEHAKKQHLDWLDTQWIHFEQILSLLFGVLFLLLISVLCDWLLNAMQESQEYRNNPLLTALSHASFLASLIIFTIMMCYYLWNVSSETHHYKSQTQKYKDISLT